MCPTDRSGRVPAFVAAPASDVVGYLEKLSAANTDALLNIKSLVETQGFPTQYIPDYTVIFGVYFAGLTVNATNGGTTNIKYLSLLTNSILTLIKSTIVQTKNGVKTLESLDITQINNWSMQNQRSAAQLAGVDIYLPFGDNIYTSGNFATADQCIINAFKATENADLTISSYEMTLMSSSVLDYASATYKKKRNTQEEDQQVQTAYYNNLALNTGTNLSLLNTSAGLRLAFEGTTSQVSKLQLSTNSNLGFDSFKAFVEGSTGNLQEVTVPLTDTMNQAASYAKGDAIISEDNFFFPLGDEGFSKNLDDAVNVVSGQFNNSVATYGKPITVSGTVSPLTNCALVPIGCLFV